MDDIANARKCKVGWDKKVWCMKNAIGVRQNDECLFVNLSLNSHDS